MISSENKFRKKVRIIYREVKFRALVLFKLLYKKKFTAQFYNVNPEKQSFSVTQIYSAGLSKKHIDDGYILARYYAELMTKIGMEQIEVVTKAKKILECQETKSPIEQ